MDIDTLRQHPAYQALLSDIRNTPRRWERRGTDLRQRFSSAFSIRLHTILWESPHLNHLASTSPGYNLFREILEATESFDPQGTPLAHGIRADLVTACGLDPADD